MNRGFPDWFVECVDNGDSDNIDGVPWILCKKHLEELDDVQRIVLSYKQNTQLVVFRSVWIWTGLLRTHGGVTGYEGVLVQTSFKTEFASYAWRTYCVLLHFI